MKMKRVRFHASSRAIDYDVNTHIRIHSFGSYIKANRETYENPGSVSTVTDMLNHSLEMHLQPL